MAEPTLSQVIQKQIDYSTSLIPKPTKCTITKVYNDNIHADIETDNGIIKYVETISNNLATGNTGVLIYLNGNQNEKIVITK